LYFVVSIIHVEIVIVEHLDIAILIDDLRFQIRGEGRHDRKRDPGGDRQSKSQKEHDSLLYVM